MTVRCRSVVLIFLSAALVAVLYCPLIVTAQGNDLTEADRERVRNLAANVANKSEATSERLRQIIDRMYKHIDIMRVAGEEYWEVASYSEGVLKQQEAVLDSIDADIIATDTFIAQIVTAPEPVVLWDAYTTDFYRAAALLRKVHAEMLKVLGYLKSPEGRVVVDGQLIIPNTATSTTATSTASTSTSTVAAAVIATTTPAATNTPTN